MSWLVVVLRILHVAAGVFWAGSVFTAARFILPAAEASGGDGTWLMKRLMVGAGLARAMLGSGLITVLAGLWLLHIDSGGHDAAFMKTGMGLTLGIGALSALGALFSGISSAVLGNRFAKFLAVVEAQGTPPKPEQMAEAQRTQAQLTRKMRAVAVMLAVTVACMAIARYVQF